MLKNDMKNIVIQYIISFSDKTLGHVCFSLCSAEIMADMCNNFLLCHTGVLKIALSSDLAFASLLIIYHLFFLDT